MSPLSEMTPLDTEGEEEEEEEEEGVDVFLQAFRHCSGFT